jgi:hypothetical protein
VYLVASRTDIGVQARALLGFAEDKNVNSEELALFLHGPGSPVLLSTEGELSIHLVRLLDYLRFAGSAARDFRADLVMATMANATTDTLHARQLAAMSGAMKIDPDASSSAATVTRRGRSSVPPGGGEEAAADEDEDAAMLRALEQAEAAAAALDARRSSGSGSGTSSSSANRLQMASSLQSAAGNDTSNTSKRQRVAGEFSDLSAIEHNASPSQRALPRVFDADAASSHMAHAGRFMSSLQTSGSGNTGQHDDGGDSDEL